MGAGVQIMDMVARQLDRLRRSSRRRAGGPCEPDSWVARRQGPFEEPEVRLLQPWAKEVVRPERTGPRFVDHCDQAGCALGEGSGGTSSSIVSTGPAMAENLVSACRLRLNRRGRWSGPGRSRSFVPLHSGFTTKLAVLSGQVAEFAAPYSLVIARGRLLPLPAYSHDERSRQPCPRSPAVP